MALVSWPRPPCAQQALFCYVASVSLAVFKGHRRTPLTGLCAALPQDQSSVSQKTQRSRTKAAGLCGSRLRVLTSSLTSWCGRVWHLAGKRRFCFQGRNKHWDRESCPASPRLDGTQAQVGTVPTGHSEGRTATDPRGRLCHGPIWGPSILVFLVESGVWLRSRMVSCPGTVQRHCGGGRGGRGVQSLLLLARFWPPSGTSPGTGREMLWVNVWPQ